METNENKYFLPMAVVLAGLLIAGAVMWNGSNPIPTAGPTDGTPKMNIRDVKVDGVPYIGRADAPITIAFWSDFQCPYCKAFEVGHDQIPTPAALPDIIKNYVDTGKVRVVFKDVVFLSPRMGTDSLTAVLYSQSVWKLYPDRYFDWRTAMFTAQDEEGAGFGDISSIDKLNATITSIDAAKVSADVKANTDAYTQVANATTAEAQKLGINSTPSTIIGTKLIVGALPFESFKSAIDEMLK